jgi:glycosyltransferase involved in cell wall biosynthesis
MRGLSGDEQLKRDLRNRGLERAKTFSWERTAAHVARLYREFLSRSKTATQTPQ